MLNNIFFKTKSYLCICNQVTSKCINNYGYIVTGDAGWHSGF